MAAVAERLPQLRSREVIRALQNAGFHIVRTTGGHTIMYKAGLPRAVPVPQHSGDLKRPVLASIVREAGLTVDEFLRFLRD